MEKRIKDHLSDIDNVIIYLLVFCLFFYELYDEGVRKAVWSVASLAFLASGWFAVAYIVGSIRVRNFLMDISDTVSVVYFLGFSFYWIVDQGFNRKAFILILPILTSLIFVSAYLFTQTHTYRRLDKWENRLYKRMFSIFKKKT